MKKLRNKKGFTLVEIIVVLVILAILAAASIPTMLGFVNDAKGKAEIANARAAYVACQMIAVEDEATGAANLVEGTEYIIGTGTNSGDVRLKELLGADITGAKVKPTSIVKGKVVSLEFVNKGYKVTIDADKAATVAKVG